MEKYIHRCFLYFNKTRAIHSVFLFASVYFAHWPPLFPTSTIDAVPPFPPGMKNMTLAVEVRKHAYAEKCFLSPSISVDQMETYERMSKLVAHLCFAAMGFSILAQGLYKETNPGRSASPYESYCWYWRITACVVGSYACHQLASALACRPMEVTFDLGFFSMLSLQMGTFVSCLAFAYTLGAKFALCKRLE